jgi:hypothetical protein
VQDVVDRGANVDHCRGGPQLADGGHAPTLDRRARWAVQVDVWLAKAKTGTGTYFIFKGKRTCGAMRAAYAHKTDSVSSRLAVPRRQQSKPGRTTAMTDSMR